MLHKSRNQVQPPSPTLKLKTARNPNRKQKLQTDTLKLHKKNDDTEDTTLSLVNKYLLNVC